MKDISNIASLGVPSESVDILYRMKAVIVNLKIYPIESKTIQDSLALLYSSLTRVLGKYRIFEISESEKTLLINANPIPEERRKRYPHEIIRAVISVMSTAKIKNMRFRTGLTFEELSDFMRVLLDRYYSRGSCSKSIIELMREKELKHIRVNEVEYRSVGSGDLLLEGGRNQLEKNEEALEELSDVIKEINSINDLKDFTSAGDEEKLAVMDKLLKINPELLPKFLDRNSVRRYRAGEQVYSANTQSELKRSVLTLIGIYRDIKKHFVSEKESAFAAERLSGIISFFSEFFEGGELSDEVRRVVEEDSLPELINATEGKGTYQEYIRKRYQKIIDSGSSFVREKELLVEVPEIMQELYCEKDKESVQELLIVISNSIQSEEVSLRRLVSRILNELTRVLFGFENPGFGETLLIVIKNQLDLETDPSVYKNLGESILSRAYELIKSGHYGTALDIFTLIFRHKKSDNKNLPQCAEQMQRLLSEEGDIFFPLLIEKLKSESGENREIVYKILGVFGETFLMELIEEIKTNQSFRYRRLILNLLEYMGRSAVSVLADEITKEKDSKVIIRILQLFPETKYPDIVFNRIKHAAEHKNPRIRVEAILNIARMKVGRKEIGELLLKSADDSSELVRREAIKALGDIKYKESFEYLSEIIRPKVFSMQGESDMIQRAACMALGKLSDKRSVPILLGVIKRGGFLKFQKESDLLVKIAAVRALVNMRTPEVEETMRELLKSDDKYLRESAAAALKSFVEQDAS